MITIIVAISENYAIGKNNDLLCHLSADLKRFKALTTGHTVVMGRRTYESLPNGALPNRRNIVVSTTMKTDVDAKYEVASSLEEALKLCSDEEEVFIIGGAQIYKAAISLADCLQITHIHHTFDDADTFFPKIDSEVWQQESSEFHFADEKNPFNYSFVEYRRK